MVSRWADLQLYFVSLHRGAKYPFQKSVQNRSKNRVRTLLGSQPHLKIKQLEGFGKTKVKQTLCFGHEYRGWCDRQPFIITRARNTTEDTDIHRTQGDTYKGIPQTPHPLRYCELAYNRIIHMCFYSSMAWIWSSALWIEFIVLSLFMQSLFVLFVFLAEKVLQKGTVEMVL
jgi:hypothetical protein